MPAPRWVRSFIQPIAVRDVLHYLIRAAERAARGEPGVRHRRSRRLPLRPAHERLRGGGRAPAASDRGAAGAHAVARRPVGEPRHARSRDGSPCRSSSRCSSTASCASTTSTTSSRRPPRGCCRTARAVRLALERERAGEVETSWRNAEVEGAPSDPLPSDPDWAGHTVYVDERERRSSAPPATRSGASSRASAARTGGTRSRSPWAIRGWVDKLTGGVGPAARPARPRHAARRRRRRLLARRGDRPRQLPAAARGDAGAGARLARARSADGPIRRRLATTGSAPCSSRRASRAGCTGGRSCRSTASSSRAWRTGSRPRPRRRPAASGRPTNEEVTKR